MTRHLIRETFVIGLFLCITMVSAKAADYEILFGDQINATEGIAVCPDGRLFVVSNESGKLYEIIEGKELALRAEGIKKPAGIACGPGNIIFAVEFADGNLIRVDQAGGKHEIIAGGMDQPNGIAIDSSGNIYVSESKAGKVTMVGKGGKTETVVDKINYANGLFLNEAEGLLYINSTMENKLYVTPVSGENKGKKKTVAKGLTTADGVTSDGEYLYVCVYGKGEIARIDAKGNVEIIVKGLTGPATPVYKEGFLYVTSLNGKGIYKVNLKDGEEGKTE